MKKGSVLPNDEQEKICKRICELRKESGYSQKFVASYVGVNERTYRKWENGEYDGKQKKTIYFEIGHSSLVYLSELYGVSIDYILCNTDFKSISGEAISNSTGLSDESIKLLHGYNSTSKHYVDVLNILLQSPNFEDVLSRIDEYMETAQYAAILSNAHKKTQQKLSRVIANNAELSIDSPEYKNNMICKEKADSKEKEVQVQEYQLDTDFRYIISEIKKIAQSPIKK